MIKYEFGIKNGNERPVHKLLTFLEVNNFDLLPNYPFQLPLDEIAMYTHDRELYKMVDKYCSDMIDNIEEVVKENIDSNIKCIKNQIENIEEYLNNIDYINYIDKRIDKNINNINIKEYLIKNNIHIINDTFQGKILSKTLHESDDFTPIFLEHKSVEVGDMYFSISNFIYMCCKNIIPSELCIENKVYNLDNIIQIVVKEGKLDKLFCNIITKFHDLKEELNKVKYIYNKIN